MTLRLNSARLPAIDALRGVAILAVIATHFGYGAIKDYSLSESWAAVRTIMSYGWVGVDLFFVLSGFLITSLLLARRNRPDYYRDFYTRRALRILPVFLVVFAILVASGLMPAAFIFTSIFFVANFAGPGPAGNPFGILW